MDKNAIIEFFDRLAPGWDDDMVRPEEVIKLILDNAGVSEGKKVLDVACGTGVLIPDYLARGASHITAVDISPEMARIASEKFAGEKVTVICKDVEELEDGELYDCIVVYNAFPHFVDPERLIANLAGRLAEGGCLTVAHGRSREQIEAHHSGTPSKVSGRLMTAGSLAYVFYKNHLDVTTVISDDRMYQVCGIRRPAGAETED